MMWHPSYSQWVLVALAVSAVLNVDALKEEAFTITVKAGTEECLYFEIDKGISIEAEFQVVSGGALDLDWYMFNPQGQQIDAVLRQQDHMYEGIAIVGGDYRICLNNRFSTVTDKEVFILIMLDTDDDNWEPDDEEVSMTSDETQDKEDKAVQILEASCKKIHDTIQRATLNQDHLRARETRHRRTAQGNLNRVNNWSTAQCILTIIVGFAQIVAIKRFFNKSDKMAGGI